VNINQTTTSARATAILLLHDVHSISFHSFVRSIVEYNNQCRPRLLLNRDTHTHNSFYFLRLVAFLSPTFCEAAYNVTVRAHCPVLGPVDGRKRARFSDTKSRYMMLHWMTLLNVCILSCKKEKKKKTVGGPFFERKRRRRCACALNKNKNTPADCFTCPTNNNSQENK